MFLNNFKRSLFAFLYYFLAQYLPGNYMPFGFISKNIRSFVCKRMLKSFGNNVDIGNRVVFFNARNTEIGSNSGIGAWSSIGTTIIGDYVMMGTHCLIISQNHRHDNCKTPMCKQGFLEDQPVLIQDDVWIGSRVIILPGVIVGKGSIIGAGSVVTNNIEPYSVVAGNPAKVINHRCEPLNHD